MLLGYSGPVAVYQYPDLSIQFTAEANGDEDGGRHAYHPGNTGLDNLANARDGRGGWCGIVLDAQGNPVIQGSDDPAPGYYVSPTTYQWAQFAVTDPRRYVDAETVPFAVVPGWLRRQCKGILIGCAGELTNLENGMKVNLVTADVGPRVGEFSVAALRAIGVDSNPRTGGDQSRRFACTLFPGTEAVINGTPYPLIRG